MLVGNRIVARRQRDFVKQVQEAQPSRPLRVQVLRSGAEQTKTPWETLADAPAGELWTRTIALNEVVFDFDSHDWSEVRHTADRVCAVLDHTGAKYLLALTGGKGVHVHVWLDFRALRLDAGLLERANRVDVCPFSEVREVFASAVLDGAGVPRDARWSKDGGIVDILKIRWSADRLGSMIREFGCRGSKTFRKTLVDHLPENRPWLEHEPPRLRFPAAPPTPYVLPGPLVQRVVRALGQRVSAAEQAAAAPTALEGVRMEDVPCVLKTMTEGVRQGSRHMAHINLVVTAFRLGHTAQEAREALQKAVAIHGLSEGDTVEKLVQQVYSGRWRAPANLACPSPGVSGMCEPSACPLSKHLDFC